MKNYHTHTKRCGHAIGEDEEYVLRAIENGFDEIGFSDHAPMLFPDGCGYYSTFRMKPYEAEGYAKSIHALKNKYRDQIKIYLGFELEYYPELFEKELKFLKSFDIDYLIMGQHFTGNEYDGNSRYSGLPTKDSAQLASYVTQCLEGLKTGEFLYLAHPDLIHFTGDKEIYLEEMHRLCMGVKELGIPLEYNFLGYYEKRSYPRDDFWKTAAACGCEVITGLDAHTPAFYTKTKEIKQMKERIRTLGIEPIEKPKTLK